ncbi:thioredoxin family protein [Flavobacterium sp. 3HN19-14]|uniref:thioredoxin family protein n=1 Tax=Flavobacterium sp. 3HN19-14 TaxID=3448133 RepID=UPI003EE128D2
MMKKLAIILFFGLCSMAVQAQDLKWYDNVDEASTVAVKAKKPLLLFFTGSDWCGWCIRLQKEVMFTPEFKKWATDNVILVELDYPRSKQLAPENQTTEC